MGQDTIQTTPIDRAEYEAFRAFVKETHGKVRGNLKRELENALREYRQPEDTTDQLTRIENDLATLKAQVADAESDGGTVATTTDTTPSDPETTRPRNSGKPAANQPRHEKVAYLVGRLCDVESTKRDSGETTREAIREVIQTEYNFADGTAADYTDDILNALDAEENPIHGRTVAWGERLEYLRQKVSDEIDEVSQ